MKTMVTVWDVRWEGDGRRGPSSFATDEAATRCMRRQFHARDDSYFLEAFDVSLGCPATVHTSTSMLPCTVVAISPSGKTVTVRQDKVLRGRKVCGCESRCDCPPAVLSQPDAQGREHQCRASKDGTWRLIGGGSRSVTFGARNHYRDPHV
jgi:hypothetical protein